MSDTTALTTTVKPGYKTTEFWLATAAMILGALFASGVISEGSQADKILGLAASILGTLGYQVSRGLAKSK